MNSTQPISSNAPAPLRFLDAHKITLAILLVAILFGGIVGWGIARKSGASVDPGIPSDSTRTNPGPWGELYVAPFTISAPDDIIPIRGMEENGTHWFFKGFSHEDLATLLHFDGVPPEPMQALLDPKIIHDTPTGLDVTPPLDVIFSIPPDARRIIYRRLIHFPENDGCINFVHKDLLKQRLEDSGISQETMDLFKKLCCEDGDYFVFSGLSNLLAQLPTYEEKLHLVKALTRQNTMLFRLRITSKSDINALSSYWGRGSYGTDVHTILESLSKVKGGTWVDILEVLPPIPSSELYFYPVAQDNPLNGPPVRRDCHWTSFNFFRDTPDPRCSDPNYYVELLRTNYAPIVGDPRYGDLVLFQTPDGDAVHSAIYLADNIVFTKNGSTFIHPWMLDTIADLEKLYGFWAPEGERLNIVFYRNKSL